MAINIRDLILPPQQSTPQARDILFPANVRSKSIQQTSQGYPVTGQPIVGSQTSNLPSGGRSIGQPPAQILSGQSKTKSGLPVAFQNIVATGSATPQMATLINQQTGDRQAVPVGSAQAQMFFGQGYVLEQSPGVAVPGAIAAPQPQAPVAPPTIPTPTTPQAPSPEQSNINLLKEEQTRLRQEAFESVYGYTPDEWQDLMPDAQRRLRNQRIQDLAGQLGDVNTAISVVKQELEDAKEDAKEAKNEAEKAEEKKYDRAISSINNYLEHGVLDTLPKDQLDQLVKDSGMNVEALKQISSKKEERPKLEQLGSDLYEVIWNDKTKSYSTRLVQRGKVGGGVGGIITVSDSSKLAAQQLLSEVDISNSNWFSELMLTVSDIYPDIKTRTEVQKALNQLFEQQNTTGTKEVMISDLFDEGIENGESPETIARDLQSLGYDKDAIYKEYQSRFK